MFLEFYQLPSDVFGVTPDPRRLYLGSSHREALASLLYGLKCGRGFLALVAKPGMGKTSMLFYLLDQLRDSARTALIFQTQCNPSALLRLVLTDLGVKHVSKDRIAMHYQLNELLMQEAARGRQVVVMIDEAQNLSEETLESIRLLSNFENPSAKLIQIILAGQPPLADKLARPGLVQLRQRVAVMAHLEPFSRQDTELYIRHRLNLCGYSGRELFDSDAISLIADLSDGIPRRINALCFNALSIGCALRKEKIDGTIVREAAADADISSLQYERRSPEYLSVPTPPVDRSPFAREDCGEEKGEESGDSGVRATARRKVRLAIGGAAACGCLIAALYTAPGRTLGREFMVLSNPSPARPFAKPSSMPPVEQNPNRRSEAKVIAPSASAVHKELIAPNARVRKVQPISEAKRRKTTDPSPRTAGIARPAAETPYLQAILERQAWVLQKAKPESGAKVVPFRQTRPSHSADSADRDSSPASSEPIAAPMQVASAVQRAKLISTVDPKYPPLAKANKVEGEVVLAVIIAKDGSVEQVKYVSGPPVLATAAMNAVEQWRYQQTYRDGRPVEVETTVRVPFAVTGNVE